jgi:hypothetical protein
MAVPAARHIVITVRPGSGPLAGVRVHRRSPRAAWRAVAVTTCAALVFTIAWLSAPPMGVDLAAQVARGEFWAGHGAAVLDFGWYGGTSPYSYSLITPAAMAWLGGDVNGARILGAVAAVAAGVLLVLLFVRTGARRPVLGGVLGAVGIVGNLVSGRITFTAGLAFGLATLLVLTSRRGWVRYGGALFGGVLTGAASPVAGLFVALAGIALMLTVRSRRVDGLLVAAGSAVSIAAMSLAFGVNGPMNTIPSDTLRSLTVSLLVVVLVPRPPIRMAAVLSAGGVLAAAILSTPVGLNAGRLSATFALAVLAAYAPVPDWIGAARRPHARAWSAGVLTLLLVGVASWQHPVAVRELAGAGNRMASPAAFRPLLTALSRYGPLGRVEVVPTADYWEAAYVAAEFPLARGWLRQADAARNALFFTGHLTAGAYLAWLQSNGVTMVAIARGPVAPGAGQEARLVRRHPSYLTRVWHDEQWTLYHVAGAPSVVDGATLLASTDVGVTLEARSTGDVLVRVRWSRWLAVRGTAACLTRDRNGWTDLHVMAPGRYEVTGSLFHPGPTC